MSYGEYSGPDKPNKGLEGGACNRQWCQAEPASWYNHGSHKWYCDDCARDISGDTVNARTWPADFTRLFPGRIYHPMFETRRMINAREAKSKTATYIDEVVALLTPLHIRALDELDSYYGRGPGHLAATLGNARHPDLGGPRHPAVLPAAGRRQLRDAVRRGRRADPWSGLLDRQLRRGREGGCGAMTQEENSRYAAIADRVVPEYRNDGKIRSCTGVYAKCWGTAYEGARLATEGRK